MKPGPTPEQKAFQAELKRRLLELASTLLATDQDVVKLLQGAKARITEQLAAQPSDFALWRLQQLLPHIQTVLAGATDSGAARVDLGLRTVWQQGEDFIDKPLAAAGVNVETQLPLLDTTVLAKLREFTTGRIRDIGTVALQKINHSLGLVTIGAKTPFEAIRAVQAALGDEARSRATTIVRTELGRAFALASQQRLEQAAEKVPGLQKQWRRSGKIHSRWNHDAIDGQVVDVGKPFVLPSHSDPIHMMHPHDPKAPVAEVISCGCKSLPYNKAWAVATPGAKPFSKLELKLDKRKADLDQMAKRAGLRRT